MGVAKTKRLLHDKWRQKRALILANILGEEMKYTFTWGWCLS